MRYQTLTPFENLARREPRREKIENIRDANAHAEDARPSVALRRIDRDFRSASSILKVE